MSSTGVNVGPPPHPPRPCSRRRQSPAARSVDAHLLRACVGPGPSCAREAVLRWSALAVGVFYGFSHQRTITTTQRAAHEQHEYEQKQKLIDQAKAEFAKQKNPQPASQSDGMSPEPSVTDRRWRRNVLAGVMQQLTLAAVITDVENPKFDLEKYLLQVAKDSP
ncbi:hypothetical protein PCL_07505 [Purpureocillium lilacinum]|uniref:ATP synthase F(0) complex subunit e, mitochondrial n=1 Tax=Purpureocillium lilacinum TaxID=33203 RepID=A0A2U3EI55_PURLI|nr:hypothetical protein Purlil1_8518 [Purpureocillium lilacinum]PWI74191.1 hypothetical protein PCL_07505 [Purpureocillium lilacinum]